MAAAAAAEGKRDNTLQTSRQIGESIVKLILEKGALFTT